MRGGLWGDARLRGRESCALLQERERRHLRCARLGHATPVETLQPRRGSHALREGCEDWSIKFRYVPRAVGVNPSAKRGDARCAGYTGFHSHNS